MNIFLPSSQNIQKVPIKVFLYHQIFKILIVPLDIFLEADVLLRCFPIDSAPLLHGRPGYKLTRKLCLLFPTFSGKEAGGASRLVMLGSHREIPGQREVVTKCQQTFPILELQ